MYKRSGAAPTPYQHRMTLERLDDSYLSVAADHSASAGIFGAPFVEAPALFRQSFRDSTVQSTSSPLPSPPPLSRAVHVFVGLSQLQLDSFRHFFALSGMQSLYWWWRCV